MNGELKGRAGALSNEERDRAFGDGLTEALQRKIGKVELSTVFVIFCRQYGEAMDSSSFNEIIRSAIGSSTLNSFGRVWFVDYQEGFFAEHSKD